MEQGIHVLHSSTNRAEDDGEVKSLRLAPLVVDLVTQRRNLRLGQVGNSLKVLWVACDERTLLQLGKDVGDVVLVGELFNITEDL